RTFKPDGADSIDCKGSFISGIQDTSLLAMAAGTTMLAIRFTTAGARSILHLPTFHLKNQFLDASCVLGNEVNELQDRLLESSSTDEMFELVNTYLTGRIQFERRMDVVAAIAEGFPFHEAVSIKKLADYAGYSHKQLISLFRNFVGVTPKMFQRLRRFQHTLDSLSGQNGADWHDLVYRLGYYDQAHFINEFKTFSGYTPTRYLQIKGDYPNYIPLQQDLTPQEPISL
ncbi:MAG: helix-turn-helix domain-containing protein, partial [Calditrichota bacterium]